MVHTVHSTKPYPPSWGWTWPGATPLVLALRHLERIDDEPASR
jgi:hypothetical protein